MKFKTLGCRLNTFETETIKSITEKLDFKKVRAGSDPISTLELIHCL